MRFEGMAAILTQLPGNGEVFFLGMAGLIAGLFNAVVLAILTRKTLLAHGAPGEHGGETKNKAVYFCPDASCPFPLSTPCSLRPPCEVSRDSGLTVGLRSGVSAPPSLAIYPESATSANPRIACAPPVARPGGGQCLEVEADFSYGLAPFVSFADGGTP